MNTAPLFTPEYTDLVSLLAESVKRHSERPLFGTRGADAWHWTTYGEFASLVDRFRGGLASLGVKRGDKVAVISQNRLEWIVGAHAVYSLGAGYVPSCTRRSSTRSGSTSWPTPARRCVWSRAPRSRDACSVSVRACPPSGM